MRFCLMALVTACVLGLFGTLSTAADNDKTTGPTTITGVLIDQTCGAKMMKKDDPQAAAEDHPKSCATKESCEKSGYAVISGKEMITFDDNGNKLAKDFLAKTDKTDHLDVVVEGTRDGDKIAVTSLKAAGEDK